MKTTILAACFALGLLVANCSAGLSPHTLLWSEPGTGRIGSILPDASSSNFFMVGLNGPADVEVDVDDEKVYWADTSNHVVQRANFDGSNLETLVSSPLVSAPWGIAIDAATDRLFYSDYVNDAVYVAALDGSNPTPLFSLNDVRDIDFDPRTNSLYVAGGINNTIYKASANAPTALTAVYAGAEIIEFLDVDASSDRIFWTTFGSPGQLLLGSRDGNVLPVVLDAFTPSGSGVKYDSDNDTLYWVENTSEVFRMVVADGVPHSFVGSGASKLGLALVVSRVPEPPAATSLGWLLVTAITARDSSIRRTFC